MVEKGVGKQLSSPILIDGHARQIDDLRSSGNDDILGADSLIVAIKASNLHLCWGLEASPAFCVGDLPSHPLTSTVVENGTGKYGKALQTACNIAAALELIVAMLHATIEHDQTKSSCLCAVAQQASIVTYCSIQDS